ncbi:FtsK/SpoIIIE domain-containing protein [Streptomyces sp. NPDC000927]|uniref:FtsK/SpoIIIE domain-containing protein n=1 Tax=Streptomyces sp. NPDC000927 TaxID=3154371 RepID=UPI0033177071
MTNHQNSEAATTSPALMRLGKDTVTGNTVNIPLNDSILIAGGTGSGKTRMLRSLAGSAIQQGCYVTVLDPKGGDPELWDQARRVASTEEEIVEAIDELHQEMRNRREEMRKRNLAVWDGPVSVTASR